MIEIERKFLVKSDSFKDGAVSIDRIVQGFLNTDPERTVRVRIKGGEGYLTVKGISSASGASRFEWERKIAVEEAEQLLPLCEDGVLEKQRFNVPVGRHLFEVDVFLGENEGLTLAEIELGSEGEAFDRPDWLGQEVTGDPRYYNSQLSSHPYSSW